jgi:hypothetical protein
MKHFVFRGVAVGLGLVLSAATVKPATTPIAQAEIAYLLTFVEQSGCAFERNGSWYDSKRAREHLRTKYEALLARHQIDTAEDFISKAATQSSLSGHPYQVRCGAGPVVFCQQWLNSELIRFRSHGAPRISRGALRENLSRLS